MIKPGFTLIEVFKQPWQLKNVPRPEAGRHSESQIAVLEGCAEYNDQLQGCTMQTNERQFAGPIACRNRFSQEPSTGTRLDFHCVSNHMRQHKPGFYLILLRTELRHRT